MANYSGPIPIASARTQQGYFDTSGYFYLPGATQTDGAPEDLLELIHPHWSQFPPQNQMWNSLLAVMYTFLWILNTIGNLAVIGAFLKTKSLQSPANILVVNLAFADFLMMLSQGPFFVLSVMRSRWWSFGALGCELYGFSGGVTGVVAILSMFFIGYDRYVVIAKGISGPRLSHGKAVLIVLFTWAYSVGINLPPFLGVWSRYVPEGMLSTCSFDYLTETPMNKYYCLFIFIFAYVFPLLGLVFVYSKIVTAVWAHEKALRDQAKKMNVESLRSNADANDTRAEIRIAKAAFTSVFLWICIWTPYAMVVMIGAFGDRMLITPLVSQLPSLLAKTASCVNPVVFAISHPRFKEALRKHYPRLYCASGDKSDGVSDAQSNATTVKS